MPVHKRRSYWSFMHAAIGAPRAGNSPKFETMPAQGSILTTALRQLVPMFVTLHNKGSSRERTPKYSTRSRGSALAHHSVHCQDKAVGVADTRVHAQISTRCPGLQANRCPAQRWYCCCCCCSHDPQQGPRNAARRLARRNKPVRKRSCGQTRRCKTGEEAVTQRSNDINTGESE